MNNVEQITFFGNLGADPELKYTQKQEPVCHLSIAEDVPDKGKPIWHKVVVWGKQGERCKVHLKKGSPVFVRGRILEKEIQAKDGRKTIKEVNAISVGFLNV